VGGQGPGCRVVVPRGRRRGGLMRGRALVSADTRQTTLVVIGLSSYYTGGVRYLS
jgi:hypothetical protein